MAETENESKPQKTASRKRHRLTALVMMALVMSVGSLIWTTYSLLDLYQVGGVDLMNMELRDLSPVGLSAAATADLLWTITMIAQYRGVQILARWPFGKNAGRQVDILPLIGWIEVLFVAGLLAYHGSTMLEGAAAFAAILPIGTKVSWSMALADLRDPTEPSSEAKAQIEAIRRKANEKRAKVEATADLHHAEMQQLERDNERLLAQERLKGQLTQEQKRNKLALERMELEGAAELQMTRDRTKADVLRKRLEGQNEIADLMREYTFTQSLRAPVIQGQIMPPGGVPQQLTSFGNAEEGSFGFEELNPLTIQLAQFGLTEAQQRQAALAHSYYGKNAEMRGQFTKKDFCEANGISRPATLSEATGAFPLEWFVDNNLATWNARV